MGYITNDVQINPDIFISPNPDHMLIPVGNYGTFENIYVYNIKYAIIDNGTKIKTRYQIINNSNTSFDEVDKIIRICIMAHVICNM